MALVAPSFNDMIATGKAEMQFRRPDLELREGDVTVADLHAAATMGDLVIGFLVQLFANTFIDQAEGDALTQLVNDHLNIQRNPATAAQAMLQFTRTSSGAGGTIPAATPVATNIGADSTSVTFLTDVDLVIPPSSNGPFLVSATAQAPGPAGNVAAGTLVNIGAVLFDLTFAVTNPAAAGGGNDEETDAQLRARARSWWQTLRRGTTGALIQGALTVPSVRVATVSEDPSQGLVTVMVSDADGNSTAQMVSDVTIEEENWRAAGVNVTVVGGQKALVDLRIGLKTAPGFDIVATTDILVAAVKTRMNRLKVDELLYQDMVIGAIVPLYPDDILQVKLLGVTVNGVAVDPTEDPIPSGSATVVRPGTITIEALP